MSILPEVEHNSDKSKYNKAMKYALFGALFGIALTGSIYLVRRYFEGLRRKKRELLASKFQEFDWSKLRAMNAKLLAKLWKYYDHDDNGYLDPNEIQMLVGDVLAKIGELGRANDHEFDTAVLHSFATAPKTSKLSNFTEEQKKEALELLISIFKDEQKRALMTKNLLDFVDVNKDGFISKDEFFAGFAKWFEEHVILHLHSF